ncbi:hypothetical protein [Mesorhizobium sp.]|uniref:hypothetical protein n=1 Tax=Mesorhizobium sp. TaxID=1871066 RepID=UPI00258FD7DE|nr:hypothetical protein [Mesorhizobium sp.]
MHAKRAVKLYRIVDSQRAAQFAVGGVGIGNDRVQPVRSAALNDEDERRSVSTLAKTMRGAISIEPRPTPARVRN